ncbi:MAG: MarC family protein [Lentisphaerae bacterium]|nr:MarC family protein [Lentisphaerota bacterium]
MTTWLAFLLSVWMKLFFLFTPFFALSMFLSLTTAYTEGQRRRLVLRIALALATVCLLLYFFGNVLFAAFGITVDAFRVGAGALLFLSAAAMVQRTPPGVAPVAEEDIAVVPMAVPVIAGPATIGTLLVMGVDVTSSAEKIVGCLGLFLAIASVAGVLLIGAHVERLLGKRGINILSKLTGLVLAALAAQMILQGVSHALAGAAGGR